MKRLNVITGHFGSGKTEVAINLARKWRAEGIAKVTVVDLDIVSPYFCSRDCERELAGDGIRVISQGRNLANAELMVLSPEVLAAFQQKDHTVIFDVGGDDMGALALGQYKRFFQAEEYEMYFVVNASRPMTRDPASVREYLESIERASRLQVTQLVNNTNLGYATSLEQVRQGEVVVDELARQMGLPKAFTAVRRDLAGEAAAIVEGEMLIMDLYMKPPWTESGQEEMDYAKSRIQRRTL